MVYLGIALIIENKSANDTVLPWPLSLQVSKLYPSHDVLDGLSTLSNSLTFDSQRNHCTEKAKTKCHSSKKNSTNHWF